MQTELISYTLQRTLFVIALKWNKLIYRWHNNKNSIIKYLNAGASRNHLKFSFDKELWSTNKLFEPAENINHLKSFFYSKTHECYLTCINVLRLHRIFARPRSENGSWVASRIVGINRCASSGYAYQSVWSIALLRTSISPLIRLPNSQNMKKYPKAWSIRVIKLTTTAENPSDC